VHDGALAGPTRVWRGRMIYQWCGCGRCPKKTAYGVKGKTKRVSVWLADTPVGRVRARMKTEEGQAVYAARKQIVEPVFGRLKHNLGFRRLLLRGVSGARIEWSLMCMGHNLRKWARAVELLDSVSCFSVSSLPWVLGVAHILVRTISSVFRRDSIAPDRIPPPLAYATSPASL